MANSDEQKVIAELSKMVEALNVDAAASTGACVYTAGAKTYCAVLTQDQCNGLRGAWTAGGKCPG